MVKVGLNIKNGSKVFKPKAGDVVIFDGEDWYITTKDDIFREYQEKMDAELAKVEAKLAEVTEKLRTELEKNEQFKREVSSQIIEISENVKKFIKLQGDK